MRRGLVTTSVVAVVLLFCSSPAPAGEPPNQNDPCSTNGRNTCGTLGVGSYETYRYGVRWFGSYRGAAPGETTTYCIDFRYWYPSAAHGFRVDTSSPLRNRDGELVSLERQRRMAYAVWDAGRTTNPTQAAAVMLYVHWLMGDGRPGEADGNAIGSAVAARHAGIARDAERYHGPYRIEAKLPDRLQVGTRVTAEIRVLSSSGVPVPGVELRLDAEETAALPSSSRTNPNGVATIEVMPTTAEALRLVVRTEPLASTLPKVYSPTTGAAARNGQRLVAPASQVVTETVRREVGKLQLQVATDAVPDRVLVGEPSRDRVTITGPAAGWSSRVAVRLFGPFRSRAAIRCDGAPAWEGTFQAKGAGTYTTPPATVRQAGWYTYRLEIPDGETVRGLTTPCAVPAESFAAEVQPRVTTVVSSARVEPGATITDRIKVEGLQGESATVRADLYGPFSSREAMVCTGTPFWTGEVRVSGDGEVSTAPVKLTLPGYYTYRETIAAAGFVRATETACGEVSETTLVVGKPAIRTRISSQRTKPGATITDRVVITGLGLLKATVTAELFGPFASKDAIRCVGTPFWKGTFVATGDGTYTTAPVRLDRAGYYTYRETIVEGPQNAAVQTDCGEAAETTIVGAAPRVATVASAEVVVPGGTLFDRIHVTGLGKTPAVVELELFGPFATRAAIRCIGAPLWEGRLAVKGDGTYRSQPARIAKAGFYAYRERIVGSALVAGRQSDCGIVAETALARPLILTGGRHASRGLAGTADAGGRTPVRVRAASLALDAPVSPAVVGVAKGILAVPSEIRRAGWWSDGAAPGATRGSILIAGHRDSASQGAGAFYRLRSAQTGTKIEVQTRDGKTRRYRVVSVRTYVKESLPLDIYSSRGRGRLVLVTCGGPFDERLGVYRDNVVVTAVPV